MRQVPISPDVGRRPLRRRARVRLLARAEHPDHAAPAREWRLGRWPAGRRHERFDHSQQADVLASVRRMEVTIRAILPADPP
jgi:hypothetical protein